MKVLVVGGGGREHALVWRIVNNPGGVEHKVYCAPGNAGISEIAECVPISAVDIEGLCNFARDERIDYTIVGMDDPLALGIADRFAEEGLAVFGPVKEAAKLEWSKAYAKRFMKKYNIPTAAYECFDNYKDAAAYARGMSYPAAIKADGLAVGKGVFICKTQGEALDALDKIMVQSVFGKSGAKVIIEEFLDGNETTVMAFCDGKTVAPMVSAKDHKKAFDGDKGLNTGGMGVISPSPHYTEKIAEQCRREIFEPTVRGLQAEGIVYKGFIYFELMITDRGAFVIEYNARFGDPEAQAVLPLLKTDLLEICLACDKGTLDKTDIRWDNRSSICIVIASGGYPESGYKTGFPISGIDGVSPKILVFHAATKKAEGVYTTGGGRVLGITATGESPGEALDAAYDAVKNITFEGMHYRTDIGR